MKQELLDRLIISPLYVLPHHLLSRVMYILTRCTFTPWKNWLIRWFIRAFSVDMSLAKEPLAERYDCFNAFFTRELTDQARPIAEGEACIACPVDGAISQLGALDDRGAIFQAKGRRFTLDAFLASDQALIQAFNGGSFATLYLSPKDYHRIHMPLAGRLVKMIYVPGRLFPVNERSARVVDALFARNERVISVFETKAGPMALVMVGATFVGSMETVWHSCITPARPRHPKIWHYGDSGQTPVELAKGQEMGRFNMGSTVVLLFGPGKVEWSQNLSPGSPVTMGQPVGRFVE